MLSLRLPIPTENTLLKPKRFHFQSTRTQTLQFPSLSLPINDPNKLLATAKHVAFNDGFGLAGDLPGEEQLPVCLCRESLPRHVAVILDGNGRWAGKRGLPAWSGHVAGARRLRDLIRLSCNWGIKVLTVFAFSTDNWARSKVEVDFIMILVERQIKLELDYMMRQGIRLSTIGDTTKLPPSLQKLISDAKEITKDNSRLQFIIALNYGGKFDVVQACKSIAHKVKDDLVKLEDIDETLIEQELETKCTKFPYPDLLIRTSGEFRVSNFLLWQLAYTEFFFVQALWPDFGKTEFIEALTSFQQRKRRYGARDTKEN